MKPLKTMLAMILALAMCVGIFSGCQVSNPAPQSGNDSATTTTEATTTTTEPVTETKLNDSVFSVIGKTYSEITAMFGELVKITRKIEGGFPAYRFESSDGYYSFGSNIDWNYEEKGTIPTDENGDWITDTAPRPKTDAQCGAVWYIPVHEIFLGLTETVNAEKLAEMYGMEHTSSVPAERRIDGYDTCNFKINDFQISIRTEENYMIGPNNIVSLIKQTKS